MWVGVNGEIILGSDVKYHRIKISLQSQISERFAIHIKRYQHMFILNLKNYDYSICCLS